MYALGIWQPSVLWALKTGLQILCRCGIQLLSYEFSQTLDHFRSQLQRLACSFGIFHGRNSWEFRSFGSIEMMGVFAAHLPICHATGCCNAALGQSCMWELSQDWSYWRSIGQLRKSWVFPSNTASQHQIAANLTNPNWKKRRKDDGLIFEDISGLLHRESPRLLAFAAFLGTWSLRIREYWLANMESKGYWIGGNAMEHVPRGKESAAYWPSSQMHFSEYKTMHALQTLDLQNTYFWVHCWISLFFCSRPAECCFHLLLLYP